MDITPEEIAKVKADTQSAKAAEAQKLIDDAAAKALVDAKAKEEAEAKAKAEAEEAEKNKASDSDNKTGEGDDEEKELDTDVWGDTGSEVGNSVLSLLQESGIAVDEAKALMLDAIYEGDVTKIDQAALEAKVGKARATLILSGASTFVNEAKTKNEGIITDVHNAAGSKENWEKMIAWGQENGNVSEDQINEYATMIDAGGAKARFAVGEIMAAYNADEKNTALTGNTRVTPSGNPTPPAGAATTQREYYAAMEKENRKMKPDPSVIAGIKAARARGRAQGK